MSFFISLLFELLLLVSSIKILTLHISHLCIGMFFRMGILPTMRRKENGDIYLAWMDQETFEHDIYFFFLRMVWIEPLPMWGSSSTVEWLSHKEIKECVISTMMCLLSS